MDEKEPSNEFVQPAPSEALSNNLVAFKVQLGLFNGVPPEEIQQKLNSIPNVEQSMTVAGLTRYLVGSTTNYKDIIALREAMAAQGFPDAVVVAFFKGQVISIQEALHLLGE